MRISKVSIAIKTDNRMPISMEGRIARKDERGQQTFIVGPMPPWWASGMGETPSKAQTRTDLLNSKWLPRDIGDLLCIIVNTNVNKQDFVNTVKQLR